MDSAEIDLFISYASADDKLSGEWSGWVVQFVKALQNHLPSNKGGEVTHVYFDQENIDANEALQSILDACRRAKLMLVVSSPSYQARKWTAEELAAFTQSHPDDRSLFVVDVRRFTDARLPQIEGRHYARFYEESTGGRDAHTHMPLSPQSQDFARRIDSLARSIAERLKELKGAPVVVRGGDRIRGFADQAALRAKNDTATVPGTAIPLKSVLLAQVTSDQIRDYIYIRDFLRSEGCTVLPSAGYPLGAAEFKQAYEADLAACGLVVQLLGPHPSLQQPGLEEGYGLFQAEAAVRAGKPLMQWVPPNIDRYDEDLIADEGQRRLLTGPDVVVSTREAFRNDVLVRLQQLSASRTALPDADERRFLFYITNDSKHRHEAAKLQLALPPGVEVKRRDDTAAEDLRRFLEDGLRECQGLLVLHGEPNGWALREMVRAKQLRGDRPAVGAICYGPGMGGDTIAYTLPRLIHATCDGHDHERWDFSSVVAAAQQWVNEYRDGQQPKASRA